MKNDRLKKIKIEAGILIALLAIVSISGAYAELTLEDNRITYDDSPLTKAEYNTTTNVLEFTGTTDIKNAFAVNFSDGSFCNWSTMITNSNGKARTPTSANLQLSIWDLNATGGTIDMPPGIIDVTNAIRLSNRGHVTIVGHNTTLRQTASSSDSTFMFNACNNITITGITIDGQKSLQVYGGDAYSQNGIVFHGGNCNDILISDCYIYNVLGSGIVVFNLPINKNIIIKGNTLYNNGDVAHAELNNIYVLYGNNVIIEDNVVKNGYASNIAVSSSDYVTIQNNMCDGTVDSTGNGNINTYLNENVIVSGNHVSNTVGVPDGTGIVSESDNKVTISDNVVEGFVIAGIYCYGIPTIRAEYFSIVGNIINGTSRQETIGIALGYASNGTVSDNAISYMHGGTTYGISVADHTNGVSFTGNSIYNVTQGIVDGTTCYNNVYSSNVLHKIVSYGMFAYGKYSSYVNNILFDCAYAGLVENVAGDYNIWSGNIVTAVAPMLKIGGAHSIYTNNLFNGIFNNTYMVIPTGNVSSFAVGYSWYDVSTHKLYVYEGAGVWKSSTFS